MVFSEHKDKAQLRAASPSVKPSDDCVRHRHSIFDGVLHSVGVYWDLMKLSTQFRAHSGIMSNKNGSEVPLKEVSALAFIHVETTVGTAAKRL